VVSQANTLADLRGWTRFVGLQIQYSLIERTPERDLLPMARALDIAVTPWGILGAGVLTGKYNDNQKVEGRAGRWSIAERSLNIAQVVGEVAKEIGCTASQVAIAWLRQQLGVIIPLLGARTAAQLEDNLGALNVILSDEHLTRLDEVSKIELGFPHEFLHSENILDIVFGGTYHQIDNHHPR
jgi:aryl-alcohol dehydrogenase-like predicted oxidoreductase